MSPEIQAILSDAVIALAPVTVAFLLWFGTQILALIRSWLAVRLSEAQMSVLEGIIGIAVNAAEKAVSANGEEKKAYATAIIQSFLRERGLNKLADDVPLISSAIEAALNKGVHRKV